MAFGIWDESNYGREPVKPRESADQVWWSIRENIRENNVHHIQTVDTFCICHPGRSISISSRIFLITFARYKILYRCLTVAMVNHCTNWWRMLWEMFLRATRWGGADTVRSTWSQCAAETVPGLGPARLRSPGGHKDQDWRPPALQPAQPQSRHPERGRRPRLPQAVRGTGGAKTSQVLTHLSSFFWKWET